MPRGKHFLTGKEMDDWNDAKLKSNTKKEKVAKMAKLLSYSNEPRKQVGMKWVSGER
jgi:hypothetical protein